MLESSSGARLVPSARFLRILAQLEPGIPARIGLALVYKAPCAGTFVAAQHFVTQLDDIPAEAAQTGRPDPVTWVVNG